MSDASVRRYVSSEIKRLREKRFPGHGGQTDCAKAIGVNVQSWHMWEAGTRLPGHAWLRKIAAFFQVDIMHLYPPESRPQSRERPERLNVNPAPAACPNHGVCATFPKLLVLLARFVEKSASEHDPGRRADIEARLQKALASLREQLPEVG